MRFLVLGTAAGGGLPQWNCGCENCRLARVKGSGLSPQTQSSVAVSVDGENWAILNASPDIRQQIADNRALHPRELRHSPIRSVVVTNGDIDHIAGLLVLREKQAFGLFMTEALADILSGNPVFSALDPAFVQRQTIALDTPFQLLPGLTAELFPVPGKVPLFLEDDNPEVGLEGEQTVGIELKSGNQRAYYIPGCAALTEKLMSRIDGADLLLFDGTLFTDDEMLVSGTGQKTGRRMGHMPIYGVGGSLEALSSVTIGRTIYVHINNTNPIWRQGPARDKVYDAGFEVGHDGMEINLATNT
ncbi:MULTISPECIES: pyrroloquinoline quinone biosynthesis protein PqqB [unclassified Rhizobium]|uniref:pyrroloquinoline quinone biosynthesis protein PqqB n=1 Tax=unclassified Rhizobium TaxID=2613769 RepID=UPI001AD9F5EC|nr:MULTISPECIES: pyrroloquinoline quinone biosynthesis protein PqqB [unclassified Rhizobium]MBO9098018.1 pyrroloquinoline quinone biosynthesis protein PqqB [Rhizobium sp. L58/93]MBO9133199.1 pyrroloquinoline quinone biosynthesis protein PqqB [Rhizobium sp. B209b/85]MBO9168169.1 pyrroloquinoline quinone biosynthesis protein PqqB [Rhizobium sp. L245/93]MBO9184214.1 pyrroloquinoline quinone biosynthesis protein PqqB [Rhizobium sp. E27B/91]QXZ85743.1 pyrroloquinoline quinone biosynthesis protein P